MSSGRQWRRGQWLMVSRSQTPGQGIQSAAVGFQQLGKTARETGGVLRSNILPALGLSAAFGVLSGQMGGVAGGSSQASSAMLGLNRALYDIQNAVAQALTPVLETLTPLVTKAVDAFLDLDEATDGWSTKIGLAGAAAAVAYKKISPFRSLVNRSAGAAISAGRFAYGAAAGGRIGAGASTAAYRGALARLGAGSIGDRIASGGITGALRGRVGGLAGRAAGTGAGRALGAVGGVAGRLGAKALGPIGNVAGLGYDVYRETQGDTKLRDSAAASRSGGLAAGAASYLGVDEIGDKIAGAVAQGITKLTGFNLFGSRGEVQQPTIQVQGYTDEQLLAKMEELIASGAIGVR